TLTTPVTLDAEGDPDAVFIIQITGAFGTTAATGNVILTNEAQSANIFWIVEGAVSMGAGTHMEGTILGGATVTFGATTTINGRALAGSAAGTVELATAVSAVTGTPPVGTPPPIVVADTVTDANGNYLFESVQPGTYLVRWDLSSVTTHLLITTANQGGDDAFDSDGVSGDVGGLVYTTEIVVAGGTTHLSVDLGLVETLPAVKAAAMDDLAAALANFLEANYYTAENWTALLTARTDGGIAIDAAPDLAGVATAKNSALAAMDAVPTYTETLAAAKEAATDDLTTALVSHLETNYTAGNWTILNTAKTNGDIAIDAATDPAGVTSAMDAALAAMNAVPTIAGSLAAAKAAALEDLTTVLENLLETNYYSAENWATLNNVKADGDSAIHAATDPAGVSSAMDAALAAMDAMPTIIETPMITAISRTSEGDMTLVLSTTPNYLLTLQTCTVLTNWTTIATATPNTSSWTFVHDVTLATGPTRFYRVFLTP
ncbi:MAG: ice-binding family protein, partial [Kiritimatiellae bacterium]|nr:ice-binding family protein [Kiritimatiellia bacterium]